MDRATKGLIMGIAIGAAGVTLALRLRQVLEERDPQAVADRIAEELSDLEKRCLGRHDSVG